MEQETKNTLTNEEIRESGVMPQIAQAIEHNPLDTQVAAYTVIENAVVKGYKAIETGVVKAYKAVETGAVEAYRKVEDTMVDKLFRRDGETIQQAKDRLKKNL